MKARRLWRRRRPQSRIRQSLPEEPAPSSAARPTKRSLQKRRPAQNKHPAPPQATNIAPGVSNPSRHRGKQPPPAPGQGTSAGSKARIRYPHRDKKSSTATRASTQPHRGPPTSPPGQALIPTAGHQHHHQDKHPTPAQAPTPPPGQAPIPTTGHQHHHPVKPPPPQPRRPTPPPEQATATRSPPSTPTATGVSARYPAGQAPVSNRTAGPRQPRVSPRVGLTPAPPASPPHPPPAKSSRPRGVNRPPSSGRPGGEDLPNRGESRGEVESCSDSPPLGHHMARSAFL